MTGDYDVIICGAGVGGLTLAAALGRLGVRVLVLDKQARQIDVYKGELLQPRSLEILAELAALEALWQSDGVYAHFLECRTAEGDLIGGLDYRPLGGSFNHVLLHDYSAIRRALAGVAGDSVEIRHGTRVSGLLRDNTGRVNGVHAQSRQVEMTFRAALTVGADGRLSVAGRESGIAAKTEQYRHQLLAFDIEDAPPLGPRVTAFLTPRGLRALYPMPRGRARLYVQIRRGEFGAIRRGGTERWLADLVQSTPGLRAIAERLVASAARTQLMSAWHGRARALVRPGLALVGDAAHSVHPMAGQGMNAAIADAWLLSDSVRTAMTGDARGFGGAADAAARVYEEQRLPELGYVLQLSHNIATLFTATAPLQRAVARRVLDRNRTNRRLQFLLTYNMSGFGVRRFTRRDRLYQFGILRDPNAAVQSL